MKAISVLVFASLLVGGIANATSLLETETAIRGGELRYIVPTKPQPGHLATYLTLNQDDSANQPTSMTLTEDNGIRCFTVECPASDDTRFKIVEITYPHRDQVTYKAIEVLKNIPANVRIAPRQIVLNESSMELVKPGGGGFMRRTMWDLQVKQFSQQTKYYTSQPRDLVR